MKSMKLLGFWRIKMRRKMNPRKRLRLRRRRACQDAKAVKVSIHPVWGRINWSKFDKNVKWWNGVKERLGKV